MIRFLLLVALAAVSVDADVRVTGEIKIRYGAHCEVVVLRDLQGGMWDYLLTDQVTNDRRLYGRYDYPKSLTINPLWTQYIYYFQFRQPLTDAWDTYQLDKYAM